MSSGWVPMPGGVQSSDAPLASDAPLGCARLRSYGRSAHAANVDFDASGGSALNVVAVQDVARGHMLAFERGRLGERYLLGGDDMSVREVFAVIARAAGLSAPRVPVSWSVAYAGARLADAALRPLGREPQLLVLDEVRAGRLPHLFDDAKARAGLGYVSRPVVDALAEAARSELQRPPRETGDSVQQKRVGLISGL